MSALAARDEHGTAPTAAGTRLSQIPSGWIDLHRSERSMCGRHRKLAKIGIIYGLRKVVVQQLRGFFDAPSKAPSFSFLTSRNSTITEAERTYEVREVTAISTAFFL